MAVTGVKIPRSDYRPLQKKCQGAHNHHQPKAIPFFGCVEHTECVKEMSMTSRITDHLINSQSGTCNFPSRSKSSSTIKSHLLPSIDFIKTEMIDAWRSFQASETWRLSFMSGLPVRTVHIIFIRLYTCWQCPICVRSFLRALSLPLLSQNHQHQALSKL